MSESRMTIVYAQALIRILDRMLQKRAWQSPECLSLMERIEGILYPSKAGELEYVSWLPTSTGK